MKFLKRIAAVRFFILLTTLAFSLLISGCGYRVGSLTHPQLKTVAIAEVKNETYEVLASALLRDILAERFQFDNSLKLTTPEKADCIVYARIIRVFNSSISWRNNNKVDNYRANEYNLRVTVEYTVLMPGKAQPLVRRRTASGSSTYLFAHDPAIGRVSALKQCLLRISNAIVSATTESW
ncbi:MAG: hypothetical protein J5858_13200 [Lentisphaeria bacterium]|nr:hypothetical protein [Lentisphaeria bacterium]